MIILIVVTLLTLFVVSFIFFGKRQLPVLVICSSNELKMKMYRKFIPQDLINSAEFLKFSANEIPEIQGSSREVVMAKLRSYLARVNGRFPKGSVLLIDDTILEVHQHDPNIAGFPGAGTTTLFQQKNDPCELKRFKGILDKIPTFGGVWYTCSIGLIRTDKTEEFHEGTVKGKFVPLPKEKEDTNKNIDPQLQPDGEDKTLDDKDDKHPRRLAVMEMMANSKLIIELLKARDC